MSITRSVLLLPVVVLGVLLSLSACSGTDSAVQPAPDSTHTPVQYVLRSDDMGFSHGANIANQRLLESGLPVNISVIFAGPWYKEAVSILKQHPEASVGVHLCANAEWKHLKWGPVLSTDRVPSLVTEDGYFHGSYQALNIDNDPQVDEMEAEFRAQIERALKTGLQIDYLDNHMGAGMHTEAQRAMMKRLSEDYNLPISGSFGEQSPGKFSGGGYETQLNRLVGHVGSMSPDTLYRSVFHLATDTPEIRALSLDEGGPANIAKQRQIELDLLLSDEFRAALRRNRVEPVTYRELARKRGRGHHTSTP